MVDAALGNLELLQVLREQEWAPYADSRGMSMVLSNAVRGGAELDLIAWAVSDGCPSHRTLTASRPTTIFWRPALRRLDVLRWALDNGCEWYSTQWPATEDHGKLWISGTAVTNGQLEVW